MNFFSCTIQSGVVPQRDVSLGGLQFSAAESVGQVLTGVSLEEWAASRAAGCSGPTADWSGERGQTKWTQTVNKKKELIGDKRVSHRRKRLQDRCCQETSGEAANTQNRDLLIDAQRSDVQKHEYLKWLKDLGLMLWEPWTSAPVCATSSRRYLSGWERSLICW